ncbi:Uncharacterised protein [Kluyvera ascorbata]|nr:Uncharacterised protein [Kluyvera ascorbata]
MLEDIIRAYLYTQYNDDENLQAFVDAYNTVAKVCMTGWSMLTFRYLLDLIILATS